MTLTDDMKVLADHLRFGEYFAITVEHTLEHGTILRLVGPQTWLGEARNRFEVSHKLDELTDDAVAEMFHALAEKVKQE